MGFFVKGFSVRSLEILTCVVVSEEWSEIVYYGILFRQRIND